MCQSVALIIGKTSSQQQAISSWDFGQSQVMCGFLTISVSAPNPHVFKGQLYWHFFFPKRISSKLLYHSCHFQSQRYIPAMLPRRCASNWANYTSFNKNWMYILLFFFCFSLSTLFLSLAAIDHCVWFKYILKLLAFVTTSVTYWLSSMFQPLGLLGNYNTLLWTHEDC